MLDTILYFLHLSGLALWLGSTVLLVILLLSVRRHLTEGNGKPVFLLSMKAVKRFVNFAALIVLVSGATLVQRLGYTHSEKPLWLSLMEQAGGMTVLLFIIVMTWMSNRAAKKLAGNQGAGEFAKLVGRYSIALSVFALATLTVVFVVSMRLV